MTIIDMDKMGEALNTKADIDLNNTGVFSTSDGGVVNLTSSTPANASGKEVTSADFFQSNLLNYTTNRILEIPQDIKLEIDSNGKCWLKAGSKCYKPNGTVINIVNDIAVGRATTGQEFIGVTGDGSRVGLNVRPSRCYSGTTAPTGFSGYGLWLDTNTMTYKYSTDGGSTWSYADYSLPIALVTMKNVNGEVASIDQVFNGFGYIGSTVFALPGVKGQIPNGRNEDGTCNNIILTNDSVKIWTEPNVTRATGMWLSSSGVGCSGELYYYSKDNINKNILDNTTRQNCKVADVFATNGKITSFEPYTVDSVLNSSLSNLSPAGEAKLKSNIQLVNELPANPVAGVLYCIPEA